MGGLTRPTVNMAKASVHTSLDSLSTHSLRLAAFQSHRTPVPNARPPKEARIVSSIMPVTMNSLVGFADVMRAKGRSQ